MSFEEQIMLRSRLWLYPSFFFFFFATRAVLKIGEYHSDISQFHLGNIQFKLFTSGSVNIGEYLPRQSRGEY